MPRRIEFPGYKMRMDEVRRELKANGMTQQQLADKAVLPAWQVSHLLNGGLPEDIEDFRRFAEALEKPLGWFFLDEREIAALIEFHGHGPSRGKAARRQGRRPLASLLLAWSLGAAGVLGWPTAGRGAEASGAPSWVLQTNAYVAYRSMLRIAYRRWLARPLLFLPCPA